jgi:hypothetical protein
VNQTKAIAIITKTILVADQKVCRKKSFINKKLNYKNLEIKI